MLTFQYHLVVVYFPAQNFLKRQIYWRLFEGFVRVHEQTLKRSLRALQDLFKDLQVGGKDNRLKLTSTMNYFAFLLESFLFHPQYVSSRHVIFARYLCYRGIACLVLLS